jgi:membrane peptidoglycan carboxypeptidase
MRKTKGGYFTDAPTTQVALDPLSLISSTDATELTTSCSINDIMKVFDSNPPIDINTFSYTPTNVTDGPLEGRAALVEMLKEVINDTDIYKTENVTSSITTVEPATQMAGGGKYKRIIKKVMNKIKKNIKSKTTKPNKTKTTKPKTTKPKKTKPKTTKTTKPKTTKTTKPKTTKPKTTKLKKTKPKTTKTTKTTKMKSCNCKK